MYLDLDLYLLGPLSHTKKTNSLLVRAMFLDERLQSASRAKRGTGKSNRDVLHLGHRLYESNLTEECLAEFRPPYILHKDMTESFFAFDQRVAGEKKSKCSSNSPLLDLPPFSFYQNTVASMAAT